MKLYWKTAILLVAILSFPALAHSDTIIVPDDHPTIQGAIDAAVNGDTVLVKPGTYVENLDFKRKAITVMSEQGALVTVIDGGQAGSVAAFNHGEGPDSGLKGFTLTNGTGTPVEFNPGDWKTCGGGIFCMDFSSPKLRGNIITANEADYGGGIFVRHGCSPTISGNTISQNEINIKAGGIYITWDCFPSIESNTITGNDEAGIYCGGYSVASISGNSISQHSTGIDVKYSSDPVIVDNIISGSGLYGIRCNDHCDPLIMNNSITVGGLYGIICRNYSHPTIMNNTITGASTGIYCADVCILKLFNNIIVDNNSYGFSCDIDSYATVTNNTIIGNGAYGVWSNMSSVVLVNTIVWGHNKEIYYDYSPAPQVSYCNVQGGYSGTANIDSDPLFVDPANNDFHISYRSPCRATGKNSAATQSYDFEGDPRIYQANVDIGADEFYKHLYCTGDFTPGGSMEGKLVGLPHITPVGLFVGSDVLLSPIPTMWGEFWLQSPWILLGPLGALPADGVMILPTTLPPGMTVPVDVPLQALIGLKPDSLTNLFVLEVR